MSKDIDVEALQAQIDLSNSISYNIVSSWVKPTRSPHTESVSHTLSRELEIYAKRPPRLGLGATVSKSGLATSREAATLKTKLLSRKRPHSEGDDKGSAPRVGGQTSTHENGEDEQESRSAAIKATVSPTPPKKRRRHKKKNKGQQVSNDSTQVDEEEWTGFSD